MKTGKRMNTLLMSLLISACSTQPQPIIFGSDQCDLCRMGIVDDKYGAEIVTVKGKVYKFDSGECMINFNNHGKIEVSKVATWWVVSPAQPKKLIDATKAFYLHSQNFPSPMGAYLSAFETEEQLKKYQTQYGGEVWSWSDAMKNVK